MVAISRIIHFYLRIRCIGFTSSMGAYEKRRLGIFNQLNFTGLLTGILIPVAGLFNEGYLPLLAWVVAIAPAVVSGAVLVCNHYKKFQWARACYFICYPFITALIYFGKIDVGIELLFVLYSVLAFFFL